MSQERIKSIRKITDSMVIVTRKDTENVTVEDQNQIQFGKESVDDVICNIFSDEQDETAKQVSHE